METRTATIHARIHPGLKMRAEEIFAATGHTTSDILEQFYAQTVARGKVPIRLKKRRANIPDLNLMTPEEISTMLRSAKASLDKQIESGHYTTLNDAKARFKEKYGIDL